MNGGKWITRKRRLAIYLRDKFTCLYCGKDLAGANPRDLTLDHFKPLSKGGSHVSSNLVTCCSQCNSSRHTKPVLTHLRSTQFVPWFAKKAYVKVQNQRRKDMKRYLTQAQRLIGGSNG